MAGRRRGVWAGVWSKGKLGVNRHGPHCVCMNLMPSAGNSQERREVGQRTGDIKCENNCVKVCISSQHCFGFPAFLPLPRRFWLSTFGHPQNITFPLVPCPFCLNLQQFCQKESKISRHGIALTPGNVRRIRRACRLHVTGYLTAQDAGQEPRLRPWGD